MRPNHQPKTKEATASAAARPDIRATASAPLAERIAALRAEADAFIDSRAELLKQDAPGIPVAVLRSLITNRAPGCVCRAALVELGTLEAKRP